MNDPSIASDESHLVNETFADHISGKVVALPNVF
jgi:hypothetical protein